MYSLLMISKSNTSSSTERNQFVESTYKFSLEKCLLMAMFKYLSVTSSGMYMC